MNDNLVDNFSLKSEKSNAIEYVKFLKEQAEKSSRVKDVSKLNEIIKLINTKKYGLVWENYPENVEIEMKSKIPVFVEDRDKKINQDKKSENYNFILEGDNLHSLHILQKTHINKIDMIYIDPPYNTENSLTYNDKRVGEDDSYRHSKWLSFMEKRLKIAKNLLNKMGLIFISIDDNEGYNLKVLCDDIFGEDNFMGSFAVVKSEGGGQAKYIVKGHDLLLVYAKDLQHTKPLARSKDIRGKVFEKNGEHYWIQEDAYRKEFGKYGNMHYEEILEYRDKSFKDDIDKKIRNGDIILINKGSEGHILGKVRKISGDYSKYHSVLKYLNADGKKDLASFGLDGIFDYPKPVDLIKELISGTAFLRKGNFTVLDFFAGSGTTGQAALEFMDETGREINFILCTNNEVSSNQKLNFVKTHGYLEKYNPSSQTTESAIDNKIDLELSARGNSLSNLVSKNKNEFEAYGISQSVTYPRIRDVILGFEFQHKIQKNLFKKRLTINSLKNIDSLWEKIDCIKSKKEYDDYKIKIDNNANLNLIANIKSKEIYKGIPSNLKYFKTDFIVKKDFPGFYLEQELLNYITPLIEIEFATDISNPKVQIVFNEDQLSQLIDEKKLLNNSTLFMVSDIFMDSRQRKVLNDLNIEQQEIPDYFFGEEMWTK